MSFVPKRSYWHWLWLHYELYYVVDDFGNLVKVDRFVSGLSLS